MTTSYRFVDDLRFIDGELRYQDLPIDLTYNKFDDSWGITPPEPDLTMINRMQFVPHFIRG